MSEITRKLQFVVLLHGLFYISRFNWCLYQITGGNEELVKEAISVAAKISKQSRPAVLMAKAAVNSAYEIGLREGIKKEQALFGATFALKDQKEGMSAFAEKRPPHFVHE